MGEIPKVCDPGVTMMLAGRLKSANAENALLRKALDGLCGTTGTWTQRVGDGERDWRVRFSFEGETHFETQAEAHEAGQACERIVADAVHGAELARLRAEVDEQATEHAELMDVTKTALDSCDRYRASLSEARAEVERLRSAIESLDRVIGPCSDAVDLSQAAETIADALTREEGEG